MRPPSASAAARWRTIAVDSLHGPFARSLAWRRILRALAPWPGVLTSTPDGSLLKVVVSDTTWARRAIDRESSIGPVKTR